MMHFYYKNEQSRNLAMTERLNSQLECEVRLLTQLALEKQKRNDFRASIPFLARVASVVDNVPQPPLPISRMPSSIDPLIECSYYSFQAETHQLLGLAYLRTGNYAQAEASLSLASRKLELLADDDNSNREILKVLKTCYDLLIECYSITNKPHLVRGMEDRKTKYCSK